MASYITPDNNLDIGDSFCYLGDTIGAGGGCDLSIVTRIRCAWGNFRELLPLLTSRGVSFKNCGKIYEIYTRPVLLYASECWAPTSDNFCKLQRNDNAMIRLIYPYRRSNQLSIPTGETWHQRS